MTDVVELPVDPSDGGNCYHCGRVTRVIWFGDKPACPQCDSLLQWIAGGEHDPEVGNCWVCGTVESVVWDGRTPRCPRCESVLQWVTHDVEVPENAEAEAPEVER